MKKAVLLFLFAAGSVFGIDFNNFWVQSTGSNLNSGHQAAADTGAIDNTATYTGVGDSNGSTTFTPSDGSTPASSVAVGDFASLYVTAGATVTGFVGRVSAVAGGVNGAITIHATARTGTFPADSSGAHTITCKVGGAWAGPSGAVAFPVGFAAGTLTNAAGNRPRVMVKGTGDLTTVDYSITAQMTNATTGILLWKGYTSTMDDGGMVVIDGGATGTAYNLMLLSGILQTWEGFIWDHNGNTGGPISDTGGVAITREENCMYRCVFRNMWKDGVSISNRSFLVQCEAVGNNKSNISAWGGFGLRAAGSQAFGCNAHHNTGSNNTGIVLSGSCAALYCFAAENGRDGIWAEGASIHCINVVSYLNGRDGIRVGAGTNGATTAAIQNCIFSKNAGWGINYLGATLVGTMCYNRFGAGTQANGSGTFSTQDGMYQIDNTSLATDVDPFVSAATGDFRVNHASVKNAGRTIFLMSGTEVTMGYPDIGAAQHLESGSAGTARDYRLRFPRLRR